jgi:hypothetical protein
MSKLNRIENITQLRMELSRLKQLEAEQSEKIKNDIRGLKKSVAIGSAGYGISYLAQNLLFKNSNPIVKTLVSLLMGGATSMVTSGKAGALFERVKDLIKDKFTKKPSGNGAYAFDEQEIYK